MQSGMLNCARQEVRDVPENTIQFQLSALALKRQIGVSSKTLWLLKHTSMQTMLQRDEPHPLQGRVEVDDANALNAAQNHGRRQHRADQAVTHSGMPKASCMGPPTAIAVATPAILPVPTGPTMPSSARHQAQLQIKTRTQNERDNE